MRAVLIVVAALSAAPAFGQTAHSLDQVPGMLKTPESKQVFAEQMQGKPPPDRLGLHLPDGLTAQQITALLLPPGGAAKVNVVGAKKLPDQPDRYVAIVCGGGDIPTGPDDPPCNRYPGEDNTPPVQAYVGVIAMQPGTPPVLAAKPLLVDGMVNWRETDLPAAPQALDDANGASIAPDGFDGFDLAPYQIAPGQRAFGLRGTWSESYSGGGAQYSGLYLFAAIDGAVKQILAVPMSAYQDIAGDWHKDGTRDHQITDAANILIVTAHSTDGHFDLRLNSRTGHSSRTYRWSAATGRYLLVGK
jgi:hypothetical protein